MSPNDYDSTKHVRSTDHTKTITLPNTVSYATGHLGKNFFIQDRVILKRNSATTGELIGKTHWLFNKLLVFAEDTL